MPLSSSRKTHLQTRLATAGCEYSDPTGSVTPPIHMATTYHRAPDGTFPSGFVYTRDGNPTRRLLEQTLADAEGATDCVAFSSGMAAANAVITGVCTGGHLILPYDVYHGVRHLADAVWTHWGLETTMVDYQGPWESALRDDTRLVWMETPSNPLARVTDVQEVAEKARAHGAVTIVDATWMTALIQKPIELGADLVLHSTTKYLGGHSDVLGGAVLGASADGPIARIREIQKSAGAVMDPFSAWLTLRGMRSLPARLRLQCKNAARVAEYLDAHPNVQKVHFPGLPDHPAHGVAREQMAMFGAMLSFEVPGGRPAAMAVAARLRTFRRATSLGGTESLVEHRASIEPEPPTSPEGLLRLSVGIEHVDDLLVDLEGALTG